MVPDSSPPSKKDADSASLCQVCSDPRSSAALQRLDSLRNQLHRILLKYPHYANFIKEVCLDGFAEEVSELLRHLQKSEEARANAISKQSCRQAAPPDR